MERERRNFRVETVVLNLFGTLGCPYDSKGQGNEVLTHARKRASPTTDGGKSAQSGLYRQIPDVTRRDYLQDKQNCAQTPRSLRISLVRRWNQHGFLNKRTVHKRITSRVQAYLQQVIFVVEVLL